MQSLREQVRRSAAQIWSDPGKQDLKSIILLSHFTDIHVIGPILPSGGWKWQW